MGLKDTLRENFANVKSFSDLKYVDKKILIVGGTITAVLLGLYYYYLIGVYMPHKQAVRNTIEAQELKQQQLLDQQQQQQQQQVQRVADAFNNVSMPLSDKSDIPQQDLQAQTRVVDTFKVPGNYMDLSKIPPQDSSMYLDSFDVLYDYLNLVFQGNYTKSFDYLNKDFVKANNITPDSYKIYYDTTCYEQSSFYITSVQKEGSSYIVSLMIYDKEHEGSSFNTTYKLVNTNGKYSIVLDDLVSFMKTHKTVRG